MTIDGHKVAVLGLGLIGGSIARELAARGVHVAGYDADSSTLDDACAVRAVHQRLEASLAGLESATIVVVAVPVSAIHDALTRASTHLRHAALVMDVGSTKRTALAVAQSLGIAGQFVGSHPMTGDHRSGWSAARQGLFAGATVYLCPTEITRAAPLALAHELWAALGARPEIIDAGAHDARVALTSHLPHAASAAIALVLSKASVELSELGPGGRDVVRIAASSPDLWAAIAIDNADAILGALAALGSELTRFERALATRDERALHALFSAARGWTVRAGRVDVTAEKSDRS